MKSSLWTCPRDLQQRLREGKNYPKERERIALKLLQRTNWTNCASCVPGAGIPIDLKRAARRKKSTHGPDQVMVC